MIAHLRGTLLESNLTTAVIECGGVGYLVNIPICTYDKLPPVGQEASLFTELHVREDDMSLYGFATRQEQRMFQLLNLVNGIGAKTALNILSSMNIPAFCSAIASADIKALKKINGVGPKSAERMIVELRDKIKEIAPETAFASAGGAAAPKIDQNAEMAVKALEQLGFSRVKIQESVIKLAMEIPEEQRSVENIIRKSLQTLNRG